MNKQAPIAIIGAGIQGCSIAMALAEQGYSVDLYDQADAPMQRASLWNEGKLHLGYVYARDDSFNTAKAMIDGSLDFYTFFKQYLGGALDDITVSSPFNYVVHKESLLSPDQIFKYLKDCQAYLNQQLSNNHLNYWGLKEVTEPEIYSNAGQYDSRLCQAVYSSPEISIDTHKFAALIRNYIDQHPLINFHKNAKLSTISRTHHKKFDLEINGEKQSFAKMINASWESRLLFDKQLGYKPPFNWLHRYKMACHIKGANIISTPSTTVVLGPFGDLVNFNNGNYYISWYPIGKIAECSSLSPVNFEEKRKTLDKRRMVSEMFKHLGELLPEVKELDYRFAEVTLKGGHIFAWGTGDIGQFDTQLHERFNTGVFHEDNYFSVNTGKYCSASLHAREVLNYFN